MVVILWCGVNCGWGGGEISTAKARGREGEREGKTNGLPSRSTSRFLAFAVPLTAVAICAQSLKSRLFQSRAVLSPEVGTGEPVENRAGDSTALKHIFGAGVCLSATAPAQVSGYRDLWHPALKPTTAGERTGGIEVKGARDESDRGGLGREGERVADARR